MLEEVSHFGLYVLNEVGVWGGGYEVREMKVRRYFIHEIMVNNGSFLLLTLHNGGDHERPGKPDQDAHKSHTLRRILQKCWS